MRATGVSICLGIRVATGVDISVVLNVQSCAKVFEKN